MGNLIISSIALVILFGCQTLSEKLDEEINSKIKEVKSKVSKLSIGSPCSITNLCSKDYYAKYFDTRPKL